MRKHFLLILLFISLLILISGCTETAQQPTTPISPTHTPSPNPTQTPTDLPTATPTIAPTPTVTQVPIDTETAQHLASASLPVNNPEDLAVRLLGFDEIAPPPVVTVEYQVGDTQKFYVTDYNDEIYEVEATLQYATEHAYFWIDNNAQFDPADLEKLANTFENKIYPTDRRFFGSEWTPGIDGDPHIYILFARRLGFYLAGYFSSADEINPFIRPTSNGHEMFVMNIDNVELADAYTYGTLAHEFQHMIHWNLDRNETTWLNEGFSELAQFLNGYPAGDMDKEYAQDPDLQLNTWSDEDDENFRHYGASFLFTLYFLDRFGKEATQALAAHPDNGLDSIDMVLNELGYADEQGNPLTADDVVLDWAITNFLNNPDLDQGQYAYTSYKSPPKTKQTDVIRNCEPGPYEFEVHQYGVDYIRVLCGGNYQIVFDGTEQTQLFPTQPHSGDYVFWSNKGDSSDTTLTRLFDFSNTDESLTLSYWTWYDIEKGYDYVYLEASTDGVHWDILKTPSGTDRDTSGNSYGWGYTNQPRGGDWIQETVDLSDYVGQSVYLRFEYITDASLHGDGFLLDDVEIPEIGYFSDFENDDGGWQADGFIRVKNNLPQSYKLALITQGENTEVIKIEPGNNNIAVIDIDVPEEGTSVVITVIGTTRYTRQVAPYQITILKGN